jgi:hypothetical protein
VCNRSVEIQRSMHNPSLRKRRTYQTALVPSPSTPESKENAPRPKVIVTHQVDLDYPGGPKEHTSSKEGATELQGRKKNRDYRNHLSEENRELDAATRVLTGR